MLSPVTDLQAGDPPKTSHYYDADAQPGKESFSGFAGAGSSDGGVGASTDAIKQLQTAQDELSRRLDTLESSVKSVAATESKVAAMQAKVDRVDALEAKLTAMQAALDSIQTGGTAAAGAPASELGLESKADKDTTESKFSEFDARLAKLQATVDATSSADDDATYGNLSHNGGSAASPAEAASTPVVDELSAKLEVLSTSVKTRLGALEQSVKKVERAKSASADTPAGGEGAVMDLLVSLARGCRF